MFKCEKCDHEAQIKGFCPVDGTALKQFNAGEKDNDNGLEKLLSDIKSTVKAQTEEVLKEYGLDKGSGLPVDKGQGNGKGMTKARSAREYVKGILAEEDQETLDSFSSEKEQDQFLAKCRSAYFFKHIVAFQVTKDPAHLAHVKALAEGTDAVGGYLTPTEFRMQLVRDMKDKPFLRNLVTVIPMKSDNMSIPTLTSDVQTSWGSENTTISTTTARFGELTLSPSRLNTFMYTSRELVADSAIGVIQLITTLFGEAIGREEDRVIVNGSGTGQPKGILQETLAGIDNLNDDSTIADNIKKLPYRLNKAYRLNARWLANALALEKIAVLKDSQNQYLLKTLEEGTVMRLAGHPIEEQSDMPVDTLLLGDFKHYFLGDREQMSVETTTDGAGAFEKHQVAIKVTERIDGKVALTNAFRKITNCGFD